FAGELLEGRMRVGLSRMKRNIQDRMSTVDAETSLPIQFINPRPLQAAIKEFFTTNQLSQFMGQQNILSEVEHLRRLSALGPGGLTRERAGFEVRDVHPSHYGRLCPIHTPEGPNIGLVGHLSSYARINDYGFIETPYRKVVDGVVTNDVEYVNAFKEEQSITVPATTKLDAQGKFVDAYVSARKYGEPQLVARNDVNYMDVSSRQIISVGTSLIPFLEHDDATRALMGTNMQRQAVPLVLPHAPLVGTGVEGLAARASGHALLAEEDGEITYADSNEISVVYKSGRKNTYRLSSFVRSNQGTCFNVRPRVRRGDKVRRGDSLGDGASVDNGELALGQNLLVAYMSWQGYNFEDAIIISDRVAQKGLYDSIHIESYTTDVRDTKLGPETMTRDIPNVGESKLKDLDLDGIVRIGATVHEGDILVGKITPKGETELTPEERLLQAIFGDKAKDVKDTSLRLPGGAGGKVVDVHILSREQGDKLPTGVIKQIQVSIAQLRKVSVGDKLAGRHGNKGVISRIAPIEDMPHLPDGRPVDVILNPLGVVSRMNIGQILETHLGWAALHLGYKAATPALDGVTEEDIKEELKKAGLSENGKSRLIDGRTGEYFDNEVTVGVMYVMKLNHLVEDKIHMRSIGPYSLITQQPLGGKAQFGGQRFGEMEVWALEGYGAAYTLQEMLTIKSDDVLGRSKAYESIIKGEPIKSPNIPASFHVLVNELKGLCLDVELVGSLVSEEEDEDEPKTAVDIDQI
ncbi:MAG TPA: DNA-directed RNA polymerase subunit beta, partial [Bacteroidetes bacterium]|nr:DNA-directed RNA polymerase subunit beta [Bacteroidota bacterium]